MSDLLHALIAKEAPEDIRELAENASQEELDAALLWLVSCWYFGNEIIKKYPEKYIEERVTILLQYGANPNALDNSIGLSNRPLHWAAFHNLGNTCQLLLKFGANGALKNKRNEKFYTIYKNNNNVPPASSATVAFFDQFKRYVNCIAQFTRDPTQEFFNALLPFLNKNPIFLSDFFQHSNLRELFLAHTSSGTASNILKAQEFLLPWIQKFITHVNYNQIKYADLIVIVQIACCLGRESPENNNFKILLAWLTALAAGKTPKDHTLAIAFKNPKKYHSSIRLRRAASWCIAFIDFLVGKNPENLRKFPVNSADNLASVSQTILTIDQYYSSLTTATDYFTSKKIDPTTIESEDLSVIALYLICVLEITPLAPSSIKLRTAIVHHLKILACTGISTAQFAIYMPEEHSRINNYAKGLELLAEDKLAEASPFFVKAQESKDDVLSKKTEADLLAKFQDGNQSAIERFTTVFNEADNKDLKFHAGLELSKLQRVHIKPHGISLAQKTLLAIVPFAHNTIRKTSVITELETLLQTTAALGETTAETKTESKAASKTEEKSRTAGSKSATQHQPLCSALKELYLENAEEAEEFKEYDRCMQKAITYDQQLTGNTTPDIKYVCQHAERAVAAKQKIPTTLLASLEQAASQGHLTACLVLGRYYLIDTPIAPDKAVACHVKAFDNKPETAQEKQALLENYGALVELLLVHKLEPGSDNFTRLLTLFFKIAGNKDFLAQLVQQLADALPTTDETTESKTAFGREIITLQQRQKMLQNVTVLLDVLHKQYIYCQSNPIHTQQATELQDKINALCLCLLSVVEQTKTLTEFARKELIKLVGSYFTKLNSTSTTSKESKEKSAISTHEKVKKEFYAKISAAALVASSTSTKNAITRGDCKAAPPATEQKNKEETRHKAIVNFNYSLSRILDEPLNQSSESEIQRMHFILHFLTTTSEKVFDALPVMMLNIVCFQHNLTVETRNNQYYTALHQWLNKWIIRGYYSFKKESILEITNEIHEQLKQNHPKLSEQKTQNEENNTLAACNLLNVHLLVLPNQAAAQDLLKAPYAPPILTVIYRLNKLLDGNPSFVEIRVALKDFKLADLQSPYVAHYLTAKVNINKEPFLTKAYAFWQELLLLNINPHIAHLASYDIKTEANIYVEGQQALLNNDPHLALIKFKQVMDNSTESKALRIAATLAISRVFRSTQLMDKPNLYAAYQAMQTLEVFTLRPIHIAIVKEELEALLKNDTLSPPLAKKIHGLIANIIARAKLQQESSTYFTDYQENPLTLLEHYRQAGAEDKEVTPDLKKAYFQATCDCAKKILDDNTEKLPDLVIKTLQQAADDEFLPAQLVLARYFAKTPDAENKLQYDKAILQYEKAILATTKINGDASFVAESFYALLAIYPIYQPDPTQPECNFSSLFNGIATTLQNPRYFNQLLLSIEFPKQDKPKTETVVSAAVSNGDTKAIPAEMKTSETYSDQKFSKLVTGIQMLVQQTKQSPKESAEKAKDYISAAFICAKKLEVLLKRLATKIIINEKIKQALNELISNITPIAKNMKIYEKLLADFESSASVAKRPDSARATSADADGPLIRSSKTDLEMQRLPTLLQ